MAPVNDAYRAIFAMKVNEFESILIKAAFTCPFLNTIPLSGMI